MVFMVFFVVSFNFKKDHLRVGLEIIQNCPLDDSYYLCSWGLFSVLNSSFFDFQNS